MSKIVYVVCLNTMPCEPKPGYYTYPERVFLTEQAAIDYAVARNSSYPDAFLYTCPSEGTEEYHSYSVEMVIMENE